MERYCKRMIPSRRHGRSTLIGSLIHKTEGRFYERDDKVEGPIEKVSEKDVKQQLQKMTMKKARQLVPMSARLRLLT